MLIVIAVDDSDELDQERVETELIIAAVGRHQRDGGRRSGLYAASRTSQWPYFVAKLVKDGFVGFYPCPDFILQELVILYRKHSITLPGAEQNQRYMFGNDL